MTAEASSGAHTHTHTHDKRDNRQQEGLSARFSSGAASKTWFQNAALGAFLQCQGKAWNIPKP